MNAIAMVSTTRSDVSRTRSGRGLHGHAFDASLAKSLIAEGVGTFLLALTIISVAIAAVLQHPIAGAPYGSLAVAIGAGLVLTALAAGLGPISGAHLNPAVTVGLAVHRRFPWRLVPAYGVALRNLYEEKGFSGRLLKDVVATITADRDSWLHTIMNEERHLEPVAKREIVRVSVVITLVTLVGHLIPLAPFLFLDRAAALVAAILLCALTLFGVGVYSALTHVGSWWRNGTSWWPSALGRLWSASPSDISSGTG